MGLYKINCPQCQEPFLWFSGNVKDQRCDDCRLKDDVPDDVCCCGDSMEGHASPLTCGHSPVSMYDHYMSDKESKNDDG
jgi:hypothetical protein